MDEVDEREEYRRMMESYTAPSRQERKEKDQGFVLSGGAPWHQGYVPEEDPSAAFPSLGAGKNVAGQHTAWGPPGAWR